MLNPYHDDTRNIERRFVLIERKFTLIYYSIRENTQHATSAFTQKETPQCDASTILVLSFPSPPLWGGAGRGFYICLRYRGTRKGCALRQRDISNGVHVLRYFCNAGVERCEFVIRKKVMALQMPIFAPPHLKIWRNERVPDNANQRQLVAISVSIYWCSIKIKSA